MAGGGYAELCVAPIAQCLPTPSGLSDIEAAGLPETFFTVCVVSSEFIVEFIFFTFGVIIFFTFGFLLNKFYSIVKRCERLPVGC